MDHHLFSSLLKPRLNDDYIDRLYTVAIFVCFALLVYGYNSLVILIDYWVRAGATVKQAEYTNRICWASRTYYFSTSNELPGAMESNANTPSVSLISRYHWVPLILLCQAVISLLPCLLWRMLSMFSSVKISAVIDAARAGSHASFLPGNTPHSHPVHCQTPSSRKVPTQLLFNRCLLDHQARLRVPCYRAVAAE